MRANRLLAFRSTAIARCGCTGFPGGGQVSEEIEYAATLPTSENGLKATSLFKEDNVAIYDTLFSFTHFQPHKVHVEKMAMPEAKYYQRLTRKPWDISTTEFVEIVQRRKFFAGWYYLLMFFLIWFIFPKEKSYSGTAGSDGFWIMLPKNQPELYA